MMYIRTKKALFSKETENGLVILSKEEDKIFVLNKTAASIWRSSSGSSKVSMDKVLHDLKKEYIIREEGLGKIGRKCMSIVKRNPELFEVSTK